MRSAASLVVACLVLLPAGPVAAASPGSRVDALVADARRWFAQHTIDGRRMAIRDLEQAVLIDATRGDAQVLLARAYEEAGFQRLAQQTWERASVLAPQDAAARRGLALAWRRDGLKYVEPRSIERAIEHYRAAARLDSTDAPTWLALSALEGTRGRWGEALAAAEGAQRTGRSPAEAALAAGSAHWRLGHVERADSLFRYGLARVRRSLRERFEDVAPIASEADTARLARLDGEARTTFVRAFWVEHDPDLATPENEAQLEYWSRVTQAHLLYHDPVLRTWDERGEVYVRYGPPERATYNPVGVPLRSDNPGRGAGNNIAFPLNVLVWEYPSLGMTVTLHDRMLSDRYTLPVSLDGDVDPRPRADSVDATGQLATHDLRGVFPTLPPGAVPLEVRAQIARFEQVDGTPRLFVAVTTPGSPSDSLTAEFVVLDANARPVARLRRPLSPSACDATGLRSATFETSLRAGDYVVGASLRDGVRRGAVREVVALRTADSTLAVSDLVITCGTPLAGEPTVRLEPDPEAVVADGASLTAYFEVYHLAAGPDGPGRFEYETEVRPVSEDRRVWLQRWLAPRREGQGLGVTREDTVFGPVRRQFVRVPAGTLPPGRYRLDVRVRDVLTGAEQRRSARFTRR